MATISAMAQLAQQVGASRVVVGRKIPHPCGDPTLPDEFDFKVREEIVTMAFEALQTSVGAATVFRPSHTV